MRRRPGRVLPMSLRARRAPGWPSPECGESARDQPEEEPRLHHQPHHSQARQLRGEADGVQGAPRHRHHVEQVWGNVVQKHQDEEVGDVDVKGVLAERDEEPAQPPAEGCPGTRRPRPFRWPGWSCRTDPHRSPYRQGPRAGDGSPGIDRATSDRGKGRWRRWRKGQPSADPPARWRSPCSGTPL